MARREEEEQRGASCSWRMEETVCARGAARGLRMGKGREKDKSEALGSPSGSCPVEENAPHPTAVPRPDSSPRRQAAKVEPGVSSDVRSTALMQLPKLRFQGWKAVVMRWEVLGGRSARAALRRIVGGRGTVGARKV